VGASVVAGGSEDVVCVLAAWVVVVVVVGVTCGALVLVVGDVVVGVGVEAAERSVVDEEPRD
jgi:hypothetical protein